MTKYYCWGCSLLIDYDYLATECTCIQFEHPKYRGVCLSCIDKTPEEWDNKPGPEHRLKKVHIWSPEYKEWWRHIEKNVGEKWTMVVIKNDSWIFTIYEGTEGQKDDEFSNWYDQNYSDTTALEIYKKRKTFETFKGKQCICCN